MAQQTFDEYFEVWQDLSPNDRLQRALALRDFLFLKKQGVSAQSADGVSITRQLQALEDYIQNLRMECAYTTVNDGFQIRPTWGFGNY